MYENYKQMSADEKAQVKAIHKALRKETASRAGNLAWAFVRGFPYRRVERKTRTQTLGDGTVVVHNPPPLGAVARVLSQHIPGLDASLKATLSAWASNPDGAIPAPPPRAKKPFNREVA